MSRNFYFRLDNLFLNVLRVAAMCNLSIFFTRLNLTNVDEPFFVIDSLDSFTSFDTFGDDSLRAVVYGVSQKGRSQGTMVKEFALDGSAENRAGK